MSDNLAADWLTEMRRAEQATQSAMIPLLTRCDCLVGFDTVADQSARLVIADPPYFRIKGDFDYAWPDVDAYVAWCETWLREAHRVLTNDGSLYLWGQIGVNNHFPLFKVADWMETSGLFRVVNWITQRNTRGIGGKRGYMHAREECVFAVKAGVTDFLWNGAYTDERSTRTDLGANGKPRTNTHKRCSDVWVDIAEASQSSLERFHTADGVSFPTVKAQRLCERIIRASSNAGDLVVVPFVGSGSELVAARRLGRRSVGFEVNSRYADMASVRLWGTESLQQDFIKEAP